MKKILKVTLIVTLIVVLSVVMGSTIRPKAAAKQTWSHLTIAANGKTATGYCPHCDKNVTWVLYTRTSGHNKILNAGHYFLNESTSADGALQLYKKGMDFVLHLNGHTFERITAEDNNTGAIWAQAQNTTFSIVDDQAQKGVISGENGGWVIHNSVAGTKVVLYSGNLTTNVTNIPETGKNTNGGTIYMTTGTFEMYGGTVNGTKAVNGGAIYANNSTVGIYGGTINGGIAESGGAIYANNSTVNITDGTINGGDAKDYGGAIFVTGASSSTVTISGGTITGGTAGARGGNVYMASIYAKLNISGGTIANGVANGIGGGNIYANNGIFNLSGGTISGGKGEKGGNIYLSTGVTDATNYSQIKGSNVRISGGKATQGGNIYAAGNLTLGTCAVENGVAQQGTGLYVARQCNLTVDSSFNGETGVYYELYHLPTTNLYGKTINPYRQRAADTTKAINRNTGVFTGKLYLENLETKPLIYATSADTYMHIANAGLIGKNGNNRWFTSNAEAVAAYDSNTAYMIATAGTLNLKGGTYVVDLNGKNVTITGTGKVTCFDSTNADYKTYGKATISGPSLENSFKTTVNGKDVYMVKSGSGYTFHYMDMAILGVSVRTNTAGIYYTGNWKCDDLLASKIESFGVAASIYKMPGTDFATNGFVLYTKFLQSDFLSGKTKTGAFINNIVKNGESKNNARATTDIYAAAYVVFTDGTVTLSKDKVSYSLHDILGALEENVLDYVPDADQLQKFQDTWKSKGLNWNFDFKLSDDIKNLNTVYSKRTAYHGELHDHAATGGNSDGHYTLEQWKVGMEELAMDFAVIADHRQLIHMTSDAWDNSLFIGGTEVMSYISDYDKNNNKLHYNLIFSNTGDFENVVSAFTPFDYSYNSSKKIYEFSYPTLTVKQMKELIQLVKENNGLFVHVHPKAEGYIDYDDPSKYYFADWTGLEVFYMDDAATTEENYKLWTDLLAQGKKIWATAGSDKHAAPNTTALTTIYSDQKNAKNLLGYAKTGDMVCGPIGIRMCVGSTTMGGETDFAGQRLVFFVGDFHESLDLSHTYEARLISDTGVVYSQKFDASKPFYYGMKANDSAKFYRVEVYDLTSGSTLPVAIGNPIWNK